MPASSSPPRHRGIFSHLFFSAPHLVLPQDFRQIKGHGPETYQSLVKTVRDVITRASRGGNFLLPVDEALTSSS